MREFSWAAVIAPFYTFQDILRVILHVRVLYLPCRKTCVHIFRSMCWSFNSPPKKACIL